MVCRDLARLVNYLDLIFQSVFCPPVSEVPGIKSPQMSCVLVAVRANVSLPPSRQFDYLNPLNIGEKAGGVTPIKGSSLLE